MGDKEIHLYFFLKQCKNKFMSDTKILQVILDGQTTIRKDIKEVKDEVKKTEGRLTERIDKIGL